MSSGGLGVELSKFGTILGVWAFVQSLLPIFTGSLSDRYGYKETIFASTIVKISGYLTMATFPTYGGFFVGAVLLAAGTAIFKPGIQGTLVKHDEARQQLDGLGNLLPDGQHRRASSARSSPGFMRKIAWQTTVFYANAAIICLNFLLLLTYREPRQGGAPRAGGGLQGGPRTSAGEPLCKVSLRELAKFHVWTYLLVFSGFWFMFNSLFDVLPAHIDDWVDTSDIVRTLFGTHGTTNPVVKFFVVMNKDGTAIQPEGMLNINAGIIMTICFLVAYVGGKMRATTSMIVGTLLASVALALSGWSTLGWASVAAIAVFSIGEMLSSPKFSEFMGNVAPSDKKAMYLGFSQISLAIGWTLEGKVGPLLYDHYTSGQRHLLPRRRFTRRRTCSG